MTNLTIILHNNMKYASILNLYIKFLIISLLISLFIGLAGCNIVPYDQIPKHNYAFFVLDGKKKLFTTSRKLQLNDAGVFECEWKLKYSDTAKLSLFLGNTLNPRKIAFTKSESETVSEAFLFQDERSNTFLAGFDGSDFSLTINETALVGGYLKGTFSGTIQDSSTGIIKTIDRGEFDIERVEAGAEIDETENEPDIEDPISDENNSENPDSTPDGTDENSLNTEQNEAAESEQP